MPAAALVRCSCISYGCSQYLNGFARINERTRRRHRKQDADDGLDVLKRVGRKSASTLSIPLDDTIPFDSLPTTHYDDNGNNHLQIQKNITSESESFI